MDKPYQVVLAGSRGVGKSFLFSQLQNEAERYGSELHTVDTGTGCSALSGRDKWMVYAHCGRDGDVTVIVWDTGGMERQGLQNMSRGYFHRANAVILVHDSGDLQTLIDLDGWLQLVGKFCQSRRVVLALWSHDTGNSVNPVEAAAVEQFARSRGVNPALVCSVCAESGDSLVAAFKAVVQEVHRVATHQERPEEGTLHMHRTRRAHQQQKSSCCYN